MALPIEVIALTTSGIAPVMMSLIPSMSSLMSFTKSLTICFASSHARPQSPEMIAKMSCTVSLRMVAKFLM